MIDIETPQFPRDLDLLDPDAFLLSAQGKAWLQSQIIQWPFVRYAYDPAAKRTLRDCNAIAHAILQSKYRPEMPFETYGGMDPVELETRKNLWRLGGDGDSLIGNDHGEPWWIRSPCSV